MQRALLHGHVDTVMHCTDHSSVSFYSLLPLKQAPYSYPPDHSLPGRIAPLVFWAVPYPCPHTSPRMSTPDAPVEPEDLEPSVTHPSPMLQT